MPKMQQNTFGCRAPPVPARGSYALPRNGGLVLRGSRERKEEEGRGRGLLIGGRMEGAGKERNGPTSKGDGREGRKERGDGKGGGIARTLQVKVSRINTAVLGRRKSGN